MSVEVPIGSVEKAVREAFDLGASGAEVRHVRLEARAVVVEWEEPQSGGKTAAGIRRRLAALLRRAANVVDPGQPQGGKYGN